MVLFNITKDIVPTSAQYVFTKNTSFSGSVTVQIGSSNVTYSMANVKVTLVQSSSVYEQVKIEGAFIVPQPFVLRSITFGGYNGSTPLTATTLGNMNIQLPLGSYYVIAYISIQAPQNFDFYV